MKKNDKCLYLYSEFTDETEQEKRAKLTECYDTYYFKKAVYAGNVSICDDISDSYNYALCYAKVAYTEHNCLICEDIENREYTAIVGTLTTKDACYLNCAGFIPYGVEHDKACENIEDDELREKCVGT